MNNPTLVQWLKLPAWKVGDRGFEPRSGIQVAKKQNASSLPTRKDSILEGHMWCVALTTSISTFIQRC